jgi:uncharacterized protein (DUF1501 family)
MSPRKKHIQSRRTFIKNSGCAALGMTTLFSSVLNMKALASAAYDKRDDFSDYKTLICILLSGGADSHNMLVPRGNFEYNEYLTTRSNLAIPQSQIIPLTHNPIDGKLFGVHPDMPQTAELFNSGKLAWLSNVGTLVEPISKSEFEANSKRTPLGLFSHSDQMKHWQTGRPNERNSYGWAGRMADLIQSQNGDGNLSMNFSLSGNNTFQKGQNSSGFSLPSNGEIGLRGTNTENNYLILREQGIANLLDQEYADIYKKTYTDTFKKSVRGNSELNEALNEVGEFNTSFSNNSFSEQLKMIAKVISARESLGYSRQTFFVNFTGWDHHDEILEGQEEKLPILDAALSEFMTVLEEMGMENDVTTFTISDFGRTLTSNGDGSDHAWGGNAMIMGGAVNGGEIYGNYPSLSLNGDFILPRGVVIPTTSATEYLAELAMWFGVTQGDLVDIFPDLNNFHTPGSGYPIGFMNQNI